MKYTYEQERNKLLAIYGTILLSIAATVLIYLYVLIDASDVDSIGSAFIYALGSLGLFIVIFVELGALAGIIDTHAENKSICNETHGSFLFDAQYTKLLVVRFFTYNPNEFAKGVRVYDYTTGEKGVCISSKEIRFDSGGTGELNPHIHFVDENYKEKKDDEDGVC